MVLRYWVAYISRGIEADGFPTTENLQRLVADLSERFARTSTQLGRAKESEVRELLRRLAGRSVLGSYFGQEQAVQVPAFARVEPYRSRDGQIEVDALAENGEKWVVEVKWRLKRVGRGELEELLSIAESLGARAWCVSQAGFTPDATAFGRGHMILLSNDEDFAALAKRIR